MNHQHYLGNVSTKGENSYTVNYLRTGKLLSPAVWQAVGEVGFIVLLFAIVFLVQFL